MAEIDGVDKTQIQIEAWRMSKEVKVGTIKVGMIKGREKRKAIIEEIEVILDRSKLNEIAIEINREL